MSRQQDRSDMTPDIRIRLAEDDLDRQDQALEHTKNTTRTLIESVKVDLNSKLAGLETKMDKGFEECEERDDRTRKLLTGLLVSIVLLCVATTAGVLVALGGG